MKIALKDQKPVALAGVAGAGQDPRYASAGESRGQPRQRVKRQKNFFERLFGL
ncbi:hypothetical protein D3C72_2552260 [compost metagenome]